MGWLIGKHVLDFWQQKKFSSLSANKDKPWAHPTSNQCMLRCSRHEVNHSPTSNVMIKNLCSYTTTPPYVIITCHLIKDRDGFIQSQNSAFFFHCHYHSWQKYSTVLTKTAVTLLPNVVLPRKFCDHPQTI